MSFKPIKVSISNFQSIKSLDFEIKGLTTIVGRTNIGKSAIIRAISSSLLNSPITNMVRRGEKFCQVELHSEDWGFKWQKGKGPNKYFIDGKDEPLDSVGRGQIEEIANFGFGSVKVGDSKKLYPWFASQFKPVFLLDQSGPAITDFISDVSRLDVLQRAINIANRGRKNNKDKLKIITEDLKVQKEKLSRFNRYEEMISVLSNLREQKVSIQEYEQKIKSGQILYSYIKKCQNSVALFADVGKVNIPDAIDTKNVERLLTAKKFNDQLKNYARSIISIKDIEKVCLPKQIGIPELDKMVKIYLFQQKKKKHESEIQKLTCNTVIPKLPESPAKAEKGNQFMIQMDVLVQQINELEAKSRKLEKDLNKLNQEIAKIPKCATCEQPWDPKHNHNS